MHEQGLIKEIMNKVLREADKHKTKKIIKVKVRIGQLSHFTPQSFEEHFYHTARGTPVERTGLEISTFPAGAHCINCHKQFELDTTVSFCPFCQSVDFTIISGKEVFVESIELK
jgi:hydrogenase nickel incorporation protein HypA/HybF